MACVAQFGIIDEFETDKDYSEYEPEKYHLIAIDDDLLDDWWDQLTQLKSYFHCYSRPAFALARWGVTLIPPESLETFYRIVSADQRSQSLCEIKVLLEIIQKAISENKYVIHYGV